MKEMVRPDLESIGCIMIKQDPNTSFQGIPDYIILCGNKWAFLETKAKPASARQPNQKYYVEKFAKMSYAAFANPSNWHEVFNALQKALGVGR